MADADVTYPPLDVLKPVADGFWIVDSGPLSAMGIALPVRMTVIRLGDGTVWLHSPTRFSEGLKREIEAIGPIRHLVAPNVAHWIFLRDWQRACPGAVTWAAPGLRERKQVRASDVRLDRDLTDAAPAEWAEALDQTIVPAAFGFREVAFFHRASRTLVLTDLVQNLEPGKLPTRTRLFARLTGVASPGGTPVYLRFALRLRRREAAEPVRRLFAWAPERVIFAHGRWFDHDGTAALRRTLGWLAG